LNDLAERVRRDGGAVYRASCRPGSLSYESFSSAADLALAERGRPALLVLENLQWCDAASQALCTRLLQSVPLVLHGLLIVSSRSEVDAPEGVERIELGPLTSSAVREFLQAERVVEHVLGTTGGDPARMVALLSGQPGMLPTTARMERPGTRHLLEALAVYGRPAGPDHLLALTGGVGDLGAIVGDLVAAGILVKSITDGEMRVGFSRGALQEETYREMLPEHRRRMHAAVADLFGDREDDLEARAHHLLSAEEADRAGDVVLRAGDGLVARGQPERAADLYLRALAQTADDTLRATLDERMLSLYETQGEYAQALPYAERTAARSPGDPLSRRRLARVQLGYGQLAGARAALEDVAEPCAERAEVLLQSGDLEAAAKEAAAALERTDDGIAARNVLAKARMLGGDLDGAAPLFSQNVIEARQTGRAREEAGSLLNLGIVALEQGRLDEAERLYREGIAACARSGDRLLLALHLQHLAVLAYRQRRYTDALDGLHEAVDSLKRLNHRAHLSWLALDLAFVHLDAGDAERARALHEFAARLGGSEPPPAARRSDFDLLRGRLASLRGDAQEAGELLRKALDAGGAGTDRAGDAAIHLADLEIKSGRPEAVAGHLEAAWPPPARLQGSFLLRRGEAALAMGRLDEARSLLGRAISLVSRIHDPEETARGANSLALVCDALGRGMEARRARDQARAAEEVAARFRPPRTVITATAQGEAKSAPDAQRQLDQGSGRAHGIVGRHPRMLELFSLIDKVGKSDATVLIRGESGTGKELVAEAIHARSARARRRLVKLNCGALVDTLLASELFGHEKGAFTGAHERRKGIFEAADGGTLFLDEIADVSPRAQATLLRVLQEREFERVGGTRALRVDVRILAATHSNLEQRVADGTFREDLYYRFKGIEIDLPALRDRKEDIPLLCEHFLRRLAAERAALPLAIAADALDLLTAYRWPGNVRELENVLRSVSVFADGGEIRARDLRDYTEITRPVAIRPHALPPAAGDPVARLFEEGLPLRELKRKVEVEFISRAVRESRGNITQAARRLGMKRPRLSQLLKEHGIIVRRPC